MIKDVKIMELKKFEDERGWLTEIYRTDETSHRPVMSYASFSKFGAIRGPHEHVKQSDFFCFFGPGDFEMHLWDNRKDSPTFGEKMEMTVGESNPATILVPTGVVHGYKCISENGSWYVNLPDALFAGENKKGEIDEIRHEADTDSRFKID